MEEKSKVLFKHSLMIPIRLFIFILIVFFATSPNFIKSMSNTNVIVSPLGIFAFYFSFTALFFAVVGNIYIRKKSGIIKIFQDGTVEHEIDFKKNRINMSDVDSVKIDVDYDHYRFNNRDNFNKSEHNPSGWKSTISGSNKRIKLIFAVRNEDDKLYDFIINTKMTPKITERFIDTMKQFNIEVG